MDKRYSLGGTFQGVWGLAMCVDNVGSDVTMAVYPICNRNTDRVPLFLGLFKNASLVQITEVKNGNS